MMLSNRDGGVEVARVARTLNVFGAYLLVVGCVLALAPALLLRPLGFADSPDGWPRIVGVIVVVLAGYYWTGARSGYRPFAMATVAARCLVFIAFALMALLRLSQPALVAFGALDAVGALWTYLALRSA